MIQLFPNETFDSVPLEERPSGQFQLSSNETFDPGQYLHYTRWWSGSEVPGQCANGLCGNILAPICEPGRYVRARMVCENGLHGDWSGSFFVEGENCQ